LGQLEHIGLWKRLVHPGDAYLSLPSCPVANRARSGHSTQSYPDGIQDYEYVQILQNLGQGAFATSVIQPIARAGTNWTHDPNALEGARLQLGQKLKSACPIGA